MERVSTVLQSQPARFFVVALVASFATLQVRTLYYHLRTERNKERLNRELQELYHKEHLALPGSASTERKDHGRASDDAQGAGSGSKLTISAEERLIREQLARNYAFFGEEGMARVRGATVAIVGCGGVGSWAAIMLARTGVRRLVLIDFDYVTLSSLNRHATATRADVGTPKVQCMRHAIEAVVPWVQVDILVELWSMENEKEHGWLDGADWIVDAIDNITTKVDLLSYCHSRSLKVISSMGAGAKHDPSHIQSADISQTIADPLARSVRRRLRMHPVHPVLSGIPVVYSTEVPSTHGDNAFGLKLLPLPEEEFQKGSVGELAPFADFRVRILPVLGMIPSIFGMHIATYLACAIASGDEGFAGMGEPLAVKGRKKLWEKLAKDLTARETKWNGWDMQRRLPLTEQEIGFVFEELHRSKSTLPPYETLSKPTLVRWNLKEPLSVVNVVVMSPQDAERHETAYRDGHTAEQFWGADVTLAVQRRKAEAEEWIRAVY